MKVAELVVKESLRSFNRGDFALVIDVDSEYHAHEGIIEDILKNKALLVVENGQKINLRIDQLKKIVGNLTEMTFQYDNPSVTDHSNEAVKEIEIEIYLRKGHAVTALENKKLELWKNSTDKLTYYGIIRAEDNEFMGFAVIDKTKLLGKTYPHLHLIHTVRRFRKSESIALILLRAIKESLGQPLVIDARDPISSAGEALLKKLSASSRMKITTVNLRTKATRKFQSDDPKDIDNAFMLENDRIGFFWKNYRLPGQDKNTTHCFKLFEDDYEGL